MKTNKENANYADPDVLAKYVEEIQSLLESGQNKEFILTHLVSVRKLDADIATLLFNQASFGDMDASVQMSEQAHQQMHDTNKGIFTQRELYQLIITKGAPPAIAEQLAKQLLVLLEQTSIDTSELLHLIQEAGISYPDAQDLVSKISTKHQLIQQKQQQSAVLENIDAELREKITSWRNNAFSNSEIVQKLVEKHGVNEAEAKKMVQAIHINKSAQEREKVREKEAGNDISAQVVLGIFLVIAGIVATVVSAGTVFFYGAIVSGITLIFTGFFKKKS
ncbi:hypothetical protein BKI52_25675 [marine bacterium AO1-C]|nr:hypothetical protein BKI52_25675 [marine bacterium AO1-C]